MSYRIEILIRDKYMGDALRFATWNEANFYAMALVRDWPKSTKVRLVKSDEDVNSAWRSGKLICLEGV